MGRLLVLLFFISTTNHTLDQCQAASVAVILEETTTASPISVVVEPVETIDNSTSIFNDSSVSTAPPDVPSTTSIVITISTTEGLPPSSSELPPSSSELPPSSSELPPSSSELPASSSELPPSSSELPSSSSELPLSSSELPLSSSELPPSSSELPPSSSDLPLIVVEILPESQDEIPLGPSTSTSTTTTSKPKDDDDDDDDEDDDDDHDDHDEDDDDDDRDHDRKKNKKDKKKRKKHETKMSKLIVTEIIEGDKLMMQRSTNLSENLAARPCPLKGHPVGGLEEINSTVENDQITPGTAFEKISENLLGVMKTIKNSVSSIFSPGAGLPQENGRSDADCNHDNKTDNGTLEVSVQPAVIEVEEDLVLGIGGDTDNNVTTSTEAPVVPVNLSTSTEAPVVPVNVTTSTEAPVVPVNVTTSTEAPAVPVNVEVNETVVGDNSTSTTSTISPETTSVTTTVKPEVDDQEVKKGLAGERVGRKFKSKGDSSSGGSSGYGRGGGGGGGFFGGFGGKKDKDKKKKQNMFFGM